MKVHCYLDTTLISSTCPRGWRTSRLSAGTGVAPPFTSCDQSLVLTGRTWSRQVLTVKRLPLRKTENSTQVIYAGDSAADEFAMEALAGVAFTFKVINEDATALTKTWANSRLQGPDAVLTMLKFLQRKLAGKLIT